MKGKCSGCQSPELGAHEGLLSTGRRHKLQTGGATVGDLPNDMKADGTRLRLPRRFGSSLTFWSESTIPSLMRVKTCGVSRVVETLQYFSRLNSYLFASASLLNLANSSSMSFLGSPSSTFKTFQLSFIRSFSVSHSYLEHPISPMLTFPRQRFDLRWRAAAKPRSTDRYENAVDYDLDFEPQALDPYPYGYLLHLPATLTTGGGRFGLKGRLAQRPRTRLAGWVGYMAIKGTTVS